MSVYKKHFFTHKKYFLCTLFVVIFLVILFRVWDIDRQIKQYPAWIDPELTSILKKKVDKVPLLHKISEVIFFQGKYLTWPQMEKQLDTLATKIKALQIHFDAVVGIKSGGAILTKYLAEKLDIKAYHYVKLGAKEYNCQKKSRHFFQDLYYNFFVSDGKHKREFIVCEHLPAEVDLTQKTVLLFDEQIYNGDTLSNTIDYLLQEKGVRKVVPATLLQIKDHYQDFEAIYLQKGVFNGIMSWGYDN